MSSQHRNPAQAARDPDMAGAEAAMHRAARRARQRAEAASKAAGTSNGPAEASGAARKGESLRDPRTLPFSQAQGHEEMPGPLKLAALHLHNASGCIDAGDWAGSVRESIHAVESVARQLDPDASKTLGPALASIEKRGTLHPALKDAFKKLYGYTSDEQGIRHARLDPVDSNVGMDEAVFMLSACASFASYLWRKHMAEEAPRET